MAGLARIRLVSVRSPASARAQLVSDCLQRRGEGVILMEFQVEDAARTQAELAAEGVAFLPGPVRRTPTAAYTCTQPIHGLAMEFVQDV
ncbi:MAG: VOC family protein [Candidatus Binatia bacterium]